MSALPADVQRATRAARIVIDEDSAVQTAFPSARDGLQSPERGYFESATDAATVLAAKAALIGAYRRRFAVSCAGEVYPDPLAEVPSYQLVASELSADLPALLCRIEVDLENETTVMEVLG